VNKHGWAICHRLTKRFYIYASGEIMKNELDSKFLLTVFEKIRLNGKKEDEKYSLEGVIAFTDFDGYTLFIEDALVKLSFGFHNQYHFDYASSRHFDAFEKKLKNIVAKY
jgi:hypothetical protein